MFPPEQNKQAWADLKEMCNDHCPVMAECLAFADRFENTYRGVHGMYGGLTPRERIARRAAGQEKPMKCGKAARAIGVEKHRLRKEPLCDLCTAWEIRRDDEARRWAHARELLLQGRSSAYTCRTAHVHRGTVAKLIAELHEARQTAIVSS